MRELSHGGERSHPDASPSLPGVRPSASAPLDMPHIRSAHRARPYRRDPDPPMTYWCPHPVITAVVYLLAIAKHLRAAKGT